MKKKIIGIGILLLVLLGVGYFIYSKVTFAKKIVDENNHWDLTLAQNTNLSGEYMGVLYEKDYTISTLPKEYVSMLLVDYYIQNDGAFFRDENRKEDNTYQKTVLLEDLQNQLKNMFGPDYKLDAFENLSYGCGRKLEKVDSTTYIIEANDPETCGVFDDMQEQYLTHVRNYRQEKDQIIIYLQVAYSSPNQDNTVTLYRDKGKSEILESNYSYACFDSDEKTCYGNFELYRIILKKASDRKYYFYAIEKGTH